MTIRTTRKVVTFTKPFELGSIGTLPAGSYDVDTDEELVESLSFPFYRRIATLFHLRNGATTQVYLIDPVELEASLMRDAGHTILPAAAAD